MNTTKLTKNTLIFVKTLVVLTLLLPGTSFSVNSAQGEVNIIDEAYIELVRVFEIADLGLLNPAELAFSPDANVFFALQAQSDTQAKIITITPYEDLVGSVDVDISMIDRVMMTYDSQAKRLLLLDSASGELVEIKTGSDGYLASSPNVITRIQFENLGLQDPQGMAVDQATGDLLVLDSITRQILQIAPNSPGEINGVFDLNTHQVSKSDLNQIELVDFRSLAFNPSNSHIYLLNSVEQTIYELNDTGDVIAMLDLSPFDMVDPQSLVFAPSGDPTDDPSTINLYIADSGMRAGMDQDALPAAGGQELGRIVELSLTQSVGLDQFAYHIDVATLENTIETWTWPQPSPDPAGIAYINSSNTILICDSEVDEMLIYEDANLFESELNGTVVFTGTTWTGASPRVAFSDEPTGAAYNLNNGHVFLSDDNMNEIFEVNPESDGVYGSSDDTFTHFDTASFGSYDPAGVGFDPSGNGHLYIVDGLGKEVYHIEPGSNGVFDGVPAAGGDDVVSQFDIGFTGVNDPEGITYDPDGDTLMIVDNTSVVVQMTTSGDVIRLIDISDASGVKEAGITLAPASDGSPGVRLYITDRGVDNDVDPTENDGKVYEMSFDQITAGNRPPVVDAGPDQAIVLPAVANLDGTVTDTYPPGVQSVKWSQVSGPWPVTFGDDSLEDTTATFAGPGTFVLRLTADDGELTGSDTLTITVSSTTGVDMQVKVDESSDDAEERSTGWVTVTSPDLDLVYDAGLDTIQTVGIRFNGVSLSPGASVVSAYIQFQANESDDGDATIKIEGHDVDNAPTFSAIRWDISSRGKTSEFVNWSPPPWIYGEAGLDQRTPDISSIVQEIVDLPGWTSCNSLAFIFSGSGERVAESYDGLPDAAPTLHLFVDSGEAPVNLAPCVDAGPDQVITMPDSAILDGSVSDDGLPKPPGEVVTTWSQVSGPGTVNFTNANAVDTTASFTTSGTYTLKLTADDWEHIAFDEMTVIVNPTNPVLNLTKNGPATATVGETVEYTFTVSHDASSDGSPVSSVAVSDDVAGTAAYVSGDDGDGYLEDGESWVFNASYVIQPTDPDPLFNTATVTGLDGDSELVTASDIHSTAIEYAPVLTLNKEGPLAALVGDNATYTFTVSHDPSSDGSPVDSVAVSDDIAGTATYLSGDDGDDVLEDGESWVFTASYTIQPTDLNPLYNTGTVTGLDGDDDLVSASDIHSTIIGEVYPVYLPFIVND